jgi:hypothetical protein
VIDRRADDLRRLGITGTTAHGKGAIVACARRGG